MFGARKKKVIILALTLLILFSPNIGNAIGELEKEFLLIEEVYQYVNYYHLKDVGSEELTKGAINGILSTLDDPYTTYFTEEEYNQFTQSVNNTFVGIGIYINQKDGNTFVQSPIKGSPAELAGLLPDDIILEVDGLDIFGKSTDEVANLIKGEEGTVVNLKIKRNEEIFTKDIARAKIQLPIVESEMLPGNIGYIRLYTFSPESANIFNYHLTQLENQGMEKLIFDLRGNPGGYLDSALDISKNFIKEGPIVYITDRNQNEQVLSIEGGRDWNKPMVVLIDRGSASASEIVAGALKDYNKATIIGDNSFGKGTVQGVVDLQHGGFLKLTINEYYTPNKNKMHGVGITPDIKVDNPDSQIDAAILQLSDNAQVYKPELDNNWVKENDKNYIAIRDFVNYFGGYLAYDANTRNFFIQIGDNSFSFSLDAPYVINRNGKGYIELEQIKENFKNMSVIQNEDNITIFRP